MLRVPKNLHRALIVVSSVLVLGALAFGLREALRSPMFLVRVVEIADQPEHSPVDAQTLTALAAIPIGVTNLFEVDLKAIEGKILTNEWVREVSIQKRFPQTVSISVTYREPRALMQLESGQLSYVDGDGKVFGRVNLMFQPDLPILTGLAHSAVPQTSQIREALRVVALWENFDRKRKSQLSSLHWDEERGFRALVSYRLNTGYSKTMVQLGSDTRADLEPQFQRLERVFEYLEKNSIAARQVFADAGKKIVVKTARGS